ncbi:site-specific tyrosine recombinase XerD [Micrococcus luteus]|uniref:site-specific tyrosine recombinase XerD n=1 Tax=Micrococcus luteus TaxID=1270 RepID=UPI00342E36D3
MSTDPAARGSGEAEARGGRGAESALAAPFRRHLEHLAVERGLAANTLAAYRRDLERYRRWLEAHGVRAPADVDPGHVSGFLRALGTGEDGGRPLAGRSAARVLAAVRGLHRFWALEGLTPADPARDVHPPKPGDRLPKALPVEQVTALLEAVPVDTPAGLRDRALLEFLYGTGARISEVVGLDVDDVVGLAQTGDDGGQPVVRLFGKGSKERVVPIGSYAAAALDAWLVRGRPTIMTGVTRSTPALFVNARGGRLSRQSAWAVLKRAAERAGLEADVSPHTLRHCFATHLLAGGADVRVVQELLGHASVTTTQVYTLVTVDSLREVYSAAHPRAR